MKARHQTLLSTAALLAFMAGASFLHSSVAEIIQATAGVEVMTRGPVHEAFAVVIAYNATLGLSIAQVPPANIEEIPPDERPDGDNVVWIPGYWSWDDERNDFLWISGVWRAIPPGRQWIPGYWAESGSGYAWTSGYWEDAARDETYYLPEPPASIEIGPNVPPPSSDDTWVPGSWIWQDDHYAWRPGYWLAGREDWVWVPSHYVSAARGYVYSDGYWDYPVARRGVVFAPVRIEREVYSRPSYRYAPAVVINLAVFADQLFVRPDTHHYYFGDYYEPSYRDRGYYSSYSYSHDHRGYDPIYSHERWEHRDDRDWDRNVEERFEYRRDHEDARPPRTLAIQNERITNNVTNITNVTNVTNVNSNNTTNVYASNLQVASTLNEVAKRQDQPVRFREVTAEDRQAQVQRATSLQTVRTERARADASVAPLVPTTAPAARALPGDTRPNKRNPARPAPQIERVKTPKSSIVSATPATAPKDQTAPARPQMPKVDRKIKPTAAPKPAVPPANRAAPPLPPLHNTVPQPGPTPPATVPGQSTPPALRETPRMTEPNRPQLPKVDRKVKPTAPKPRIPGDSAVPLPAPPSKMPQPGPTPPTNVPGKPALPALRETPRTAEPDRPKRNPEPAAPAVREPRKRIDERPLPAAKPNPLKPLPKNPKSERPAADMKDRRVKDAPKAEPQRPADERPLPANTPAPRQARPKASEPKAEPSERPRPAAPTPQTDRPQDKPKPAERAKPAETSPAERARSLEENRNKAFPKRVGKIEIPDTPPRTEPESAKKPENPPAQRPAQTKPTPRPAERRTQQSGPSREKTERRPSSAKRESKTQAITPRATAPVNPKATEAPQADAPHAEEQGQKK